MIGRHRLAAWLTALAAFFPPTETAAETLAERGAYLGNGVMACANCHTPRDAAGELAGKTLAGGRVFDTPVFKVSLSNITPDKDTGIGNWTDAQLKTFLRTGERPSGIRWRRSCRSPSTRR